MIKIKEETQSDTYIDTLGFEYWFTVLCENIRLIVRFAICIPYTFECPRITKVNFKRK